MNRTALSILALLLLLVLLNACGEGEKNSTLPLVQNQADQQTDPTPSPTPAFQEGELQLSSKVTQGDFELILYTEKTHYEVDELIKVHAELIYIGEQEQVEIGHAMYPVGFDTSEHTRSLYTMGAMNEPYIVTTLKRNEPMRYEYSFSGGYLSDADQEHIDFIDDLVDDRFPAGQYTIAAHANFYEHAPIDEQQADDQQSDSDTSESRPHYSFSGSISFIVGSGNSDEVE